MMTYLIVAVAVYGLALLLISMLSTAPQDLGVRQGRLAACPDSPNCISTFADSDDSVHYLAAVSYRGDSGELLEKIKSYMKSHERALVKKESELYLYFECRTLLCRYIDDVEVYLDEKEHLIHLRSASRLGHSDLGANRRRLESLLKAVSSFTEFSQ